MAECKIWRQSSSRLYLHYEDQSIFSSPDYTLDEIFSFLESADKPCIIAIDEFQRVANYPEKNVEELLRGKIQKLSNTHIVFAGSERRILSEMFHSDKKPFYQSATTLLLEPIENEIYYAFAQKQFSLSGKQLQKEAFFMCIVCCTTVTIIRKRARYAQRKMPKRSVTITLVSVGQKSRKSFLEYPNSRKSCCMLSAQKSMQQASLRHHSLSIII